MSPAFARKLGLYIRKTNVGAQNIDNSTLETSEMVIADFQVEDKGGRSRFFQEIFLVADTKFEVILGMLFWKSAMQTWHLIKEHSRRSLIPPRKPYQPPSESN